MPRFARAAALLSLFALLAQGDPPDPNPARGVVWQVWVVEGGLEMIHGGGRWIREIHVPGANVSFNVEDARLNCFAPEAGRYERSDSAEHAPRRLGEIDVAPDLVAKLQQLLKLRDEARDAAKACLDAAPPLEK